MTAVDLLARCRVAGVQLGVGSGGASLLWEADADPPAGLLADLAANKAAILELVRGPHGNCDHCGRPLDAESRCWRCCDRACVDCGRQNGVRVHRALHPVWASVQRQPRRTAITATGRRRPRACGARVPHRARSNERPEKRLALGPRRPNRANRQYDAVEAGAPHRKGP